MAGRFLTKLDMRTARRIQDIRNSQRKRGLIESPEKITQEYHVVCGCGAEGCIFISALRSN